ncbi:heme exporter protein CcmD [Ferrovibrio sp.]|uniref:heme exporter protein CcmD n=1 Tax=Ferrovibrio sp. TaxID=1917215 RepID=UPI0026282883|nr:heme exporter protein CcmD [Ferrovibrio sp.]
MYWSSLGDFLAMGGHAAFVWLSFAVAVALLLGLALQSRLGMKAAEREHAEARQEAGRDNEGRRGA